MDGDTDDIGDIIQRGCNISRAQSEVIEQSLKLAPGDLEQRALLIGYYFIHHFCYEEAWLNRVRHIVWLVENGNVGKLSLSYCYVHLVERDAYASIKKAFEKGSLPAPNDAQLLYGLSYFSMRHEPEYALALQRRCVELEPRNLEFQEALRKNLGQKDMLIHLRDEFLNEPYENYFNSERVCEHPERLLG